MQYEVRYVAISTYYHDYLGVKMTKEEARRMGITLERPEFLAVSIKDFSLCFHILCFHYAFITMWYISPFHVDMPLCFYYVGVSKLVLWKRRVLGGIGGSLV